MQFSTAVFALASLASAVVAAPAPRPENSKSDSDTFNLLSIHSGSVLQYASVNYVESHPHVFSVGGSDGDAVTLTLKDDSTLVDSTGRGVNFDENTGEVGLVDPYGSEKATKGFSIDNSNLLFRDAENFIACPSDNGYSLTYNHACDGGIGLRLHVVKSGN